MHNWIDKTADKRELLPRVTESVSQGNCSVSSHLQYRTILDGKFELIGQIKEALLALRQVSLTVNANSARTIILGYIQTDAPELLGETASYKPKEQAPIFSMATTSRFLYDHLDWSSRSGTKDGQKTPLE